MAPPFAILVADDQPSVRVPLRVLLGRLADATVIEADCGNAALELAQSRRPQLILLDVVMPDLDGYTVCRRLRRELPEPQPQIWLLTARNSQLDTEAAGEAGADRVITKPFDPDQLFNDVRSLLPNAAEPTALPD